ncbi:26S proteasome non-ATPase regulatory subunit 9 [Cryomyces antarcticus]
MQSQESPATAATLPRSAPPLRLPALLKVLSRRATADILAQFASLTQNTTPMGLSMDELHAPTVVSGPTSRGTSNGLPKEQSSLTELIAEKENVERELSTLSAVLDSHGVNMSTSLTTFDGYPRDDIDVAQIRTTRARIIIRRNDYKTLMDQIEKGLHAQFASGAATQMASTTRNAGGRTGNTASTVATIEAPFARVNSVVPGSPAETAGLKAGDTITRFGTANWMNHEKLAKVAQVVSQNEGRPILVQVRRRSAESQAEEDIRIQLTPKRDWGGRGMLGCHLLPV